MEIKVLIPGTIPERGLLEMLFNPDIIPDNVYVDMHGGLMPAKKFFRECHDALAEDLTLPRPKACAEGAGG